MYEILTSTQFRRDIKRCKKQNKNMDLFKQVNTVLISGKTLPQKHKDHFFSGEWNGFRECHIAPDWLLIYKVDIKNKSLNMPKPVHTQNYLNEI